MIPRHTHQKESLLSVVTGRGKHLSAEQVLAAVKQKEPNIGLATVYRNLNSLCDQGVIQKVVMDGVCYYDGNPEPHDHFRCKICGEFTDVDTTYDESLDKKMTSHLGTTVELHSVLFEGICAKCAKEKGEK